jgi:hypothetical protein
LRVTGKRSDHDAINQRAYDCQAKQRHNDVAAPGLTAASQSFLSLASLPAVSRSPLTQDRGTQTPDLLY